MVIKFLKPNDPWKSPEIRVFGRIEINGGTEENPVVLEPFVKKLKADYGRGCLLSRRIDGNKHNQSPLRIENLGGIETFDGAHLDITDSQFINNYSGVMVFDGGTLS